VFYFAIKFGHFKVQTIGKRRKSLSGLTLSLWSLYSVHVHIRNSQGFLQLPSQYQDSPNCLGISGNAWFPQSTYRWIKNTRVKNGSWNSYISKRLIDGPGVIRVIIFTVNCFFLQSLILMGSIPLRDFLDFTLFVMNLCLWFFFTLLPLRFFLVSNLKLQLTSVQYVLGFCTVSYDSTSTQVFLLKWLNLKINNIFVS
jgi:hypothetical protein